MLSASLNKTFASFLQEDIYLQVQAMRLSAEQVYNGQLELIRADIDETHTADIENLNTQHRDEINTLKAELSTKGWAKFYPSFFSICCSFNFFPIFSLLFLCCFCLVVNHDSDWQKLLLFKNVTVFSKVCTMKQIF